MYSDYLEIENGTERIYVDEISKSGDSVWIRLPVFDSEIRCLYNSGQLTGNFINHSRKTNQVLPFRAMHNISWRFSDKPERTLYNLNGKWKVTWDKEEGENKYAIGLFEQSGNALSGTFLTPTGDYRYLSGEIGGKRLWLSAFDGSHAFLFTATFQKDGSLKGEFFSGSHWHDTWTAKRDDSFRLPDPDSLTRMNPGEERISFSFPDAYNNTVSLQDAAYKDKVVIVQLMGSWCPNCMDESLYLGALYDMYKDFGLEVIALDYERNTDTLTAFRNIRRMKAQLELGYPVLFAGSANKTEASKTLPMLNRIMAYPTTIVIGRDGRVRKIHTGFSGPASGAEYDRFTASFRNFIEKLLKE